MCASGEALRLEPLKSFALLSKLVLMAGTGARFSEGSDCCALNGELTSWSVEALSLLSMIIVRGRVAVFWREIVGE